LHHTGGFSRLGKLTVLLKFTPTPTLVAMVTKICEFQHKISHNSAYVRDIAENLATNVGFSTGADPGRLPQSSGRRSEMRRKSN